MTPDSLTGGSGPDWSVAMRGKGVAYLLIRLRFDADRFSGQVPQIEVAMTGRTIRDTRSVSAITITSAASGPARTGYATTTDLSFAGAHGRSVGDQLLIAGHSNALLNGYQRVDEIVDADTIRIYTPFTAGSAGNATILPYSQNPPMIVRDYLVSDRYGCVVPTTELDDTAFQTEANYCDELVTSKSPGFPPRASIISVGATNPAIIATDDPHELFTGNLVRIWNSPVSIINGLHTVTVIDPTNVTIPVNNSGGATTGGGYMEVYRAHARYQANAVLSPAESLKTNLEKLLTSFRAQMVYQAGVYRTWTRRVAYPGSFELTPNTIIPGTFRYHRPGLHEMANRVRASFYYFQTNIAAGRADFAEWPSVTGYTNPELTTEDNGFESMHEIDLPATTDSFMAEQIAQIVRNESRTGLVVGVTATQAALQLAVGDIVNVTHDTPQWNRKKFWVMQIAIQPDGLVGLTLLEYSAAAYTTKWYPDEV